MKFEIKRKLINYALKNAANTSMIGHYTPKPFTYKKGICKSQKYGNNKVKGLAFFLLRRGLIAEEEIDVIRYALELILIQTVPNSSARLYWDTSCSFFGKRFCTFVCCCF